METNKILLTLLASLTLTDNAHASNKTHVTDTPGAGNGNIEISYETRSLNLPATYVAANGATLASETKTSLNQLNLVFSRGFTERFDMGVLLPVSISKNESTDSTAGTNITNATLKYAGEGDVSFILRYLILDKAYDQISWNVSGIYSSASAPSDDPVAQSSTNGTVTTAGKDGQSGRGYASTSFASTLSIPTGAGDVYLKAQYDKYRDKITAGVLSNVGSLTSITLGMENIVGADITLTPYAKYMMQADGYNGTTILAANTKYDLGVNVTGDLSNSVSVAFGAAYNVWGDQSRIYANGDKYNFFGHGYTFTLSTLFFF